MFIIKMKWPSIHSEAIIFGIHNAGIEKGGISKLAATKNMLLRLSWFRSA